MGNYQVFWKNKKNKMSSIIVHSRDELSALIEAERDIEKSYGLGFKVTSIERI